LLSQSREHESRGRVFAIRDLRAALKQVKRLGGKPITPHDLRRTFLTFGERVGCPMVVLKRLANHSTNGDVTSGYVRPIEADLRHWASVIEKAILHAARGAIVILNLPARTAS
jgi:integrase